MIAKGSFGGCSVVFAGSGTEVGNLSSKKGDGGDMIEVIYREDVSEDSIREPRNVKQAGSVDPKYRIYLEDTVLTCIRKSTAAENEVHFGVLLGELKRAAGTTYLFIRGMVKAEKRTGEAGKHLRESRENRADADMKRKAEKNAGPKETGEKADREEVEGKRESEDGTDSLRKRKPEDGADWGRERKSEDGMTGEGKREPEDGMTGEGKREPGDRGNRERKRESADSMDDRKKRETGSGAVAFERLTLDRQRGAEGEDREREGHTTETFVEEERVERPLIELDGETWSRLYEEINHYFPDMEILGWYASFPFLNVAEFDLCREVHFTHFSGADRVLFLCDRTEREENFYRPDGPELRETEGYFTFFEKNDAMLAYQQEKIPADGQKETVQAQEQAQRAGSTRQGTVGEAPRRKWNISAASVFVTALLLAAVLVVNQYNSRLKRKAADSAEETAEVGTSLVSALAVDGTVSDPADGGDEAENGSANGGENADGGSTDGGDDADSGNGNDDAENGNAGGSDDTNDGSVTGGDDADIGSANGGLEANNGSTDGSVDAEKGSADGSDEAEKGNGDGTDIDNGGDDGTNTANGNGDGTDSEKENENGTGSVNQSDSGSDSESGDGNGSDEENESGGETDSETSANGASVGGNGTGSGGSGTEEETVQTGSRVSARYYTVKNGETLYSICMDVYKTSAMVEIVRVLNGIGEDYVIQEGQKILLP
ncbi:MAG: LysM peptidoglycan-binding domain-containing protein [Lachnospiraceae bacterium]|nr:LysM peptidoglycan-binding domain-containing protein [Lachnospiraceae bacterium]